jgi:methylated-DNA-[protein]-cysteine S-methyltransferase
MTTTSAATTTARHCRVETSLGEITLVATGDAITGLYFPHHWYLPSRDGFGLEVEAAADALLAEAARQLQEYLDGLRTEFDLTLATQGDPFQEQVWALLTEIPYGETTTYGAIAKRLGDRALAQRVGQAIGRNPLCVLVPCHRVVGAGGALTGYAGGVGRKRALLELEALARTDAGQLF